MTASSYTTGRQGLDQLTWLAISHTSCHTLFLGDLDVACATPLGEDN